MATIKKSKVLIIFQIIAVLVSLLALTDNPYGYYQFLRWIICGTASFSAFFYFKKEEKVWPWIFVMMAVLFNPVFPIQLTREIWAPINIICAILIVIRLVVDFLKQRTNGKSNLR